jgi:hypothetical protein
MDLACRPGRLQISRGGRAASEPPGTLGPLGMLDVQRIGRFSVVLAFRRQGAALGLMRRRVGCCWASWCRRGSGRLLPPGPVIAREISLWGAGVGDSCRDDAGAPALLGLLLRSTPGVRGTTLAASGFCIRSWPLGPGRCGRPPRGDSDRAACSRHAGAGTGTPTASCSRRTGDPSRAL